MPASARLCHRRSSVSTSKRTRQVVEHDQLRFVHDRPGAGKPLPLSARQAQAARADHRLNSVGHLGDVGVHHRHARWRVPVAGRPLRRRRCCRRPSRRSAVAPGAGRQHSGAPGRPPGPRPDAPFQNTSPLTSACHASPSNARSSVLLPAPTGPVMITNSPRRIENDTSSDAGTGRVAGRQVGHVESFEFDTFRPDDRRTNTNLALGDRQRPVEHGVA